MIRRSVLLAAVCGAAVLLAGSASVSVSGQATQADCDFYWKQIGWCEKYNAKTDAQFNDCVQSTRRQTPQATYCHAPGEAPDNDHMTWRPIYLAATEEEEEAPLAGALVDLTACMLDCFSAAAQTIPVQCLTVPLRRRAECQTVGATKAEDACAKKCAWASNAEEQQADEEQQSTAVGSIVGSSVKCSVECQDKLARCQKAAGADGLKRAQCLQPYNSCASACMRLASA